MFLVQLFQSGLSPVEIFIYLVAMLAAVMLAIMCHEVAHGYVALLNGDPTAKLMGRLNFNPKKHFDPIGFLMMLFVGFGWAKPVPVDFRNFKNVKKGVVTVSLAGVAANFVLAFLSYLLGFLMILIFGGMQASEFASRVFLLFYVFFFYSVSVNLSLIAFNLLPLYPLDGYRVLQAVAPKSKVTDFLGRYGNYILIGLVVLGSIVPSLDVLEIYIGFVDDLFLKLFSLIFGGWTF